jgi:hypothetical protein
MTRPISDSEGSSALARRLRELRESRFSRPVKQAELARALSGDKPLSISSISAYENPSKPPPPEPRLRDYAAFFATERSVSEGRLLADDELTAQERAARDTLLDELLTLAGPSTIRPPVAVRRPIPLRPARRSPIWLFPEGEPVRIVCGRLKDMDYKYADPANRNYTELLTFADADALIELYAHLWRVNPASDIRYLRADRLGEDVDDLNTHLVLLGGIGIAAAVQWLVGRTDLPLRQVTGTGLVADGDVFALGDVLDRFLPTETEDLGLVEDVGLLARLRNPYNRARTLTLCSGVFSRGVLGAVRSLTDDTLRDSNAAYLSERFANAEQFAILMRVPVLRGAITPDLQDSDVRLWEWSDADGEAAETGDGGTGKR